MARKTIFLESRVYRRRRLMDAVRLLPFFGLALWLVPLLWSRPENHSALEFSPTATSSAILYIFGIWAGLVVIAFTLWCVTRHPAGEADMDPE